MTVGHKSLLWIQSLLVVVISYIIQHFISTFYAFLVFSYIFTILCILHFLMFYTNRSPNWPLHVFHFYIEFLLIQLYSTVLCLLANSSTNSSRFNNFAPPYSIVSTHKFLSLSSAMEDLSFSSEKLTRSSTTWDWNSCFAWFEEFWKKNKLPYKAQWNTTALWNSALGTPSCTFLCKILLNWCITFFSLFKSFIPANENRSSSFINTTSTAAIHYATVFAGKPSVKLSQSLV